VFEACDGLKKELLRKDLGVDTIDAAFDEKNTLISEANSNEYLTDADLDKLSDKLTQYNLNLDPKKQKITTIDSFRDVKELKMDAALHNLFQIQMLILQNQ
jgi:hypothetical protein